MSSHALFRLAAIALFVSGVSLALGVILHAAHPYPASSVASTEWVLAHSLWWLGGLAGVFGLIGLYLRQRQEIGVLGFLGSSLAVGGCTLIACAMYFEAFIAPSLAALAPELFQSYPSGGGWEGFLAGVLASGALFGGGFLLFAIAMFRTDIMPRWAVILAVLGGLPFAVNFLLPRPAAVAAAVVFCVGLAGLANALRKSVQDRSTEALA